VKKRDKDSFDPNNFNDSNVSIKCNVKILFLNPIEERKRNTSIRHGNAKHEHFLLDPITSR